MNFLNIESLLIKDADKELVNINFNITTSTALIGQSGSGKSLTIKSLLGMLPKNLKKDIKLDSNFTLSKENIGFVPQNPFTSLSPLTKIGKQFLLKDRLVSKEEKIKLLKLVGLGDTILDRFPMELSGGQLQRIVIAIAISSKPKILLLDEPTTALDTDTKTNILNLLEDLKEKLNLLILFVTHDIKSIENITNDIVIIKDGLIVENGKTKEILENPKNSYTKDLINSGFSHREYRC